MLSLNFSECWKVLVTEDILYSLDTSITQEMYTCVGFAFFVSLECLLFCVLLYKRCSDATQKVLCVWKTKWNGAKPPFITLGRCENCPDLPSPPLSPRSCQSITHGTSQEHWKSLWTGGHYALISQQWMPAAASLNLSRWFQYVVNKILMQAMVPIVAGIQLQLCSKLMASCWMCCCTETGLLHHTRWKLSQKGYSTCWDDCLSSLL